MAEYCRGIDLLRRFPLGRGGGRLRACAHRLAKRAVWNRLDRFQAVSHVRTIMQDRTDRRSGQPAVSHRTHLGTIHRR